MGLIGDESTQKNRWLIKKILLAIFILVCLSGILIWKERRETAKILGDHSDGKVDLLAAFTERFNGVLISTSDFAQLEHMYSELIKNKIIAPVRPDTGNESNRYIDSDEIIDIQHHGCCTSTRNLVARPRVVGVQSSTERTVLQIEGRKQYFPNYTCIEDANSKYCKCVQSMVLYTAIVLKDGVKKAEQLDDIEFVFVKLPGCCLSLNI